jgi:RNA-directed DNA polymerase
LRKAQGYADVVPTIRKSRVVSNSKKVMSTETVYEYNTIPWKQVEKQVFKLQKRIYQATQRGNQVEVRKLQRRLTESHYAKLLAVRQGISN